MRRLIPILIALCSCGNYAKIDGGRVGEGKLGGIRPGPYDPDVVVVGAHVSLAAGDVPCDDADPNYVTTDVKGEYEYLHVDSGCSEDPDRYTFCVIHPDYETFREVLMHRPVGPNINVELVRKP